MTATVDAGLRQSREATVPTDLARQVIIGDNPDLKERELLKGAALTAVMAKALGERGVKEPTARLAAQVGALALSAAFLRWLAPVNRQTLTKLAGRALRELSAATEALR
jgi:hypothetical protein